MKIIFTSRTDFKDIAKPFAIYNYDEVWAGHSHYIDVRKIIRERGEEWLDDVHKSFAELSRKFLHYTRWWWVTGMSRLDARPWGQEHLFKPLFFARAVWEWYSQHEDVDEVCLAGCPSEVAIYFRELKSNLVIQQEKQWNPQAFFAIFLLKHVFIAVLKLIKNIFHIFRHHIFRKGNPIKVDVLVLYESVANTSLTSGYKYYYDGLLDDMEAERDDLVAYGCIDSVFTPVETLRRQPDDKVFFVLDHISFLGLLRDIFLNIYLIFLTAWVAMGRNVCRWGGYQSLRFWPYYLLSELSRTYILTQICSYSALTNIFKNHKYKCVVSTYEEKIIERAVLFSCKDAGIPVVGYVPHPQHSLTLALRDVYAPYAPKPDRYAVCGPKYIDYFLSWGNKKSDSLTVWGSQKSFKYHLKAKQLSRDDLKVLVLISHPNELGVFYSWLYSEQRLTSGVRYFLRTYKFANCKRFSQELGVITSRFNFVEEVDGDFKRNIELCDLAGFCSTSAGLLAINYGLVSIHLGLDDFFEINPCFNDLSTMFSCNGAKQFADCLDTLCGFDAEELFKVHHRQSDFVSQVFSPVQEQNVRQDILSMDSKPSAPYAATV